MKLRILNYGIAAEHEQMTPLQSLMSPRSLSDIDGFVFDPAKVVEEFRKIGHPANDVKSFVDDESGTLRAAFHRHAREVMELLWMKGGVVICILRDNTFRLSTRYHEGRYASSEDFDPYFLLNVCLHHEKKGEILTSLVYGAGNQIRLKDNVELNYLRVLKGALRFEATIPQEYVKRLKTVFATDSTGRIVAAEVRLGAGSLLLVPVTTSDQPKRVGAALVESIRALSENEIPDTEPTWVESIKVPGSSSQDEEITRLRKEQLEISTRLEALEAAKTSLLKHRYLLYSTGKHVLEPAVRRAFRVLGYTVAEPDAYEGEWDIEMRDRNNRLLIGEVEGSEGAIDVDKFRQALHYHQDKFQEGEDNKPLLVGNAFRLLRIDQRPDPFTNHAVRGATKNGMALIPTSDLFNAVCAVLRNNSDDIKAEIQDSIANCHGVWSWPAATTD